MDVKEFWKLEFRQTPRGKVAVLAISGFPQSSEPSWNGFTEAIDEILNAQCLIIDLRGNGGGDDTKAMELLSALLGHELDINWIRQIFCESAEAYGLQGMAPKFNSDIFVLVDPHTVSSGEWTDVFMKRLEFRLTFRFPHKTL